MGQRHQVFLIARVRPHGKQEPRYRCVAALHHQWCYGRLPLHGTRRLLTLLKQPINALIVRWELKEVQGKYGLCGKKPSMPDVPCPYTTLLLTQAWHTDLDPERCDDPYVHGGGRGAALPADMESWEGDNNDGITVIDITEPTAPAYCFQPGGETAYDGPERTPLLTAEQYCRAYYDVPSEESLKEEGTRLTEEDVLRTIHSLDGEPLVTMQMLAEAWPSEYKVKTSKDDNQEEALPQKQLVTPQSVPTLAELSFKSAVAHALESGDTAEIEEKLWMPGSATLIKAILQEQPILPEFGLPLLKRIITEEVRSQGGKVDLTPYSLSSQQILDLATIKDIHTLDLSSQKDITTQTIATLLHSSPNLKYLILLDTPIPSQAMVQLLAQEPTAFYNLDAIIHPAFFVPSQQPYFNKFSFIGLGDEISYPSWGMSTSSYYSPTSIVQALTDLFFPLANPKVEKTSLTRNSDCLSTMDTIQACFSAAPRRDGKSWSERVIVCDPRPDGHALQKPGWVFISKFSRYSMTGSNLFGFIRTTEQTRLEDIVDVADDNGNKEGAASGKSGLKYEVFDLRGFLEELVKEGRPPAAEEKVVNLEDIFKSLVANKDANTRPIVNDDVQSLIKRFVGK